MLEGLGVKFEGTNGDFFLSSRGHNLPQVKDQEKCDNGWRLKLAACVFNFVKFALTHFFYYYVAKYLIYIIFMSDKYYILGYKLIFLSIDFSVSCLYYISVAF